jgi:type VI secretion system protein ImpL
MKLLIGLMAFLAVGITLSRLAVTRLGVSEEDARLILYVVGAVWAIGMVVGLLRWVLARRAAAARNAKPVDPAIEALRGRIREARAGLAQLRRYQRSVAPRRPPLLSAPYRAPWLVLLGLPGHGKTTLLGPTGAKRLVEVDREGPRKGPPDVVPEDRLRLFCAAAASRAAPDLGGAAYLEVPHALARREEQRPTWLATLKLLRRREQPVHGVVLAVSVEALAVDADPTQRGAQIGEDLAQQLSDLIAGLAVHVPVYLVMTKLDRLVGFSELLGKVASREQVLGFELPDGRSDDLVLKELRARFDLMCEGLDLRALRAVSRRKEGDAAAAPRVMAFTRHLAELAEPLAALTKQLLTARGGDPLRLRGVYFTSASSGPEPAVAPVLDNLLHETGGGNYLVDDVRPPAGTRYFLDELLGGVWLRDSALATRTLRARRRAAIAAWSLAGAGLLVAAWLALGATRTTQANRELAQQTADVSASLLAQLGGERRAPLPVAELERLRALLASWEDDTGSDAAGVRGWWLFPGETVVPALQRFYKRAVFEGVLAALRGKAEAQLHDFQAQFESPDAIPEPRDRLAGRDALRFYLLLTGPKADGEHLPITQEAALLAREMLTRWSTSVRTAVSTDDYAAMGLVAQRFVGLARDEEFVLARDPALIDAVREILRRDTSEDAAVEAIIEKVSSREDLPRVSLRAIAGVPSLENDNQDVRGALTAAGWQYVKVEFQNADDGSEWVLGLDQDRALDLRRKRGRNMRSYYFTAYTQEWSRFIARMRIVNPTNLEQAKQIFGELTRGPNTPLRKVFQKLQENAVLKDDFDYGEGLNLIPFAEKKAGTGSAVRAGDIANTFAPLVAFTIPPAGKEVDVALDNYHVHLREVRDAISKALDSTEEKKALRERLVSAIDDTDALIKDGNLEAWTKDTDELLLTPLRQLRKLVELTGATEDTGNWCAAIVDPMYERFNGRYPFAADSRDDVVLADFEEFFHPENGAIRKAREELSSYITREGNYMVARDLGKSDVARIDPAVIRFLNRAQDIGMVMFPQEELRVDYEVILECNPQVSRVEWKAAGEVRVFECNDKKLLRMRWPGKEGQGAALTVFGRQGQKTVEESGEWGLFELLERAGEVPVFAGEEVLEFKFDLSAFNYGTLEVRLKPTRVRGGTAFFGLSNGDRKYLSLLRAADVIPPKRLFSNRGSCQ